MSTTISSSTAALARQLMKAADADGNGKLSTTEFKSMTNQAPSGVRAGLNGDSSAFSTMDTDADGNLSQNELATGLQSLQQDTASMLLAAQEQLSPSASTTASNASSLCGSLLSNSSNDAATLILAAYASANKLA